ncbi:hypothetical protein Tco_0037787 [Tanacetum coccineum]
MATQILVDALDLQNIIKKLSKDFNRLLKAKKAKEAELTEVVEVSSDEGFFGDEDLVLYNDVKYPLGADEIRMFKERPTTSRATTAFTSTRSRAPTASTRSRALIASTSNAQAASTAPRGIVVDMEEHDLLDVETVFSCVMPYVHDGDDRNSLSLVSRKFYELDSLTRKHVTVHVHYAPTTSRLSQRFPNIESLTLVGMFDEDDLPCFEVTPWFLELGVSFKRLNALCLRDMFLEDEDLERLGKHAVLESLHFRNLYDVTDANDLTLLAKNCSKSLVSLKISLCSLSNLGEAFRHAVRLEDCDGAYFDEDDQYLGFKLPPNMHCLGIYDLPVTSCPFVLPFVDQLRELNLQCIDFKPYCQCLLIERCPNLEVLHTEDICGDRGLHVIGQVCKKLRKLTYDKQVTHMGLISLAQECCNLEYLHLTLTSITNEALECIGTHLKNLGEFHMILDEKDGITDLPLDNGIRAMLNGCRKLERLDIRLCPGGLTDMGLGYIGNYGHNLKYLFLQNIGESDAGLVELSKGCPKLRKLEMMSCPFNRQSIVVYVFKIPSLRYLKVFYKGCHLVSTRPDFERLRSFYPVV